jgi:hypothetical protein
MSNHDFDADLFEERLSQFRDDVMPAAERYDTKIGSLSRRSGSPHSDGSVRFCTNRFKRAAGHGLRRPADGPKCLRDSIDGASINSPCPL